MAERARVQPIAPPKPPKRQDWKRSWTPSNEWETKSPIRP